MLSLDFVSEELCLESSYRHFPLLQVCPLGSRVGSHRDLVDVDLCEFPAMLSPQNELLGLTTQKWK